MRMMYLAAAALFAAASAARAEEKPDADRPFNDREFVTAAAQGGMFEVEAGRLAAARAENPQVKQFAQKMVDDHTKANKELTTLAGSIGAAVTERDLGKHQQHLDAIKAKTGAEFDKAYVAHMVKDHEQDVAAFRRASREATDPALKEFATKTLPTLQGHLEEVKKLHETIGR